MTTTPAYKEADFNLDDFKPVERSRFVYTVEDIPLVPLTEVSSTRFVASDRGLFSFITNPPGATFPLHSHEAEQILIILEGTGDRPAKTRLWSRLSIE